MMNISASIGCIPTIIAAIISSSGGGINCGVYCVFKTFEVGGRA